VSYDIYGPLAAWLPAHLLAAVNTEIGAGTLGADSVYVARAPTGDGARARNAPALCVELVPTPGGRGPALGVGFVEETIGFSVAVILRRKDTRDGAGQLDAVESILRAVAHRYDGINNLTITSLPSAIKLLSVRASARDIDEQTNREIVRGSGELLFSFLRPMESQA